MPCCAAAMLTNTQPAKSRTRLPLHNMLRRPMLHEPHSLPRLRVRLWTLSNAMRIQATKGCNDKHHCTQHRDGSSTVIMAENGMQVNAPHLRCPVPLWRPCDSVSFSSSSLLHLQSGSCCSLASGLILEGTE